MAQPMHDDRAFSRHLSGRKYNPSKQGDASFRVLYYAGATGSVPFLWESQPGTPKHKFGGDPLPPLTPPPQYRSSPGASRKKHSRNSNNILNSIFQRVPSRKITNASLLMSPPLSSSSSSSSSYSLPSTPFHTGRSNSKARSGSIGLDEDEYGPGSNSPTSTLCFGPRSASPARKGKAMKGVKKVMKSIVGHGSF